MREIFFREHPALEDCDGISGKLAGGLESLVRGPVAAVGAGVAARPRAVGAVAVEKFHSPKYQDDDYKKFLMAVYSKGCGSAYSQRRHASNQS